MELSPMIHFGLVVNKVYEIAPDDLTNSAGQTVTVSNPGWGALNISSVTFNAGALDYQLSSNACTAAALTHNQTCTFVVTFHPSATGSRPGTVRISSDASGTPTLDVSLTGMGTLPSFTLTAIVAGTEYNIRTIGQNTKRLREMCGRECRTVAIHDDDAFVATRQI